MKYEYHEGPESLEKFKRGMEILFQVPKTAKSKKQAHKPATLLISMKFGKDKD